MADYFGALTNNKIGFGHPDSYYKNGIEMVRKSGDVVPSGIKDKNFAQIMANLLEMASDPDQTRWRYIEKTTPNTTRAYKEWLEDLAANPVIEDLL